MIQTLDLHGQVIWFDPQQISAVGPEHFTELFWRKKNAISSLAGGRNTAWFIDDGEHSLLLRHYYRGGFIARFNRDCFLHKPVAQSRAMQEFSLLQKLQTLGLPVPVPVAASMVNAGPGFYRADIIVKTIPDTSDVFHLLRQQPLNERQWQSIGKSIASLHAAGVYHSDLNCHNLLLDSDDRPWIVDFDKCEFRTPGPWQQQNLQRLQRSLRKEQGKYPDFHWQEGQWQGLLNGYASGQ